MHKQSLFFQLGDENQIPCLQDLGYQCAILEEELQAVAETLPVSQRAVIEDYIAFRNTMEVASIRAAIQFGERQVRMEKESK